MAFDDFSGEWVDQVKVAAPAVAALPIVGPFIAGGASLLGGYLANQASAKQAKYQMEFQERMSNTAHQREVRDLRAAGLNPILSVSKGGPGASTPGGASAPQGDFGVGQAVSSAYSARRSELEWANLQATQDNLDADTQNKTADAKLKVTQGVLNSALAQKAGVDEQTSYLLGNLYNQETETERHRSRREKAEAERSGAALTGELQMAEFFERYPFLKPLRYLIDAAQGGTSAYRNARPSKPGITINPGRR